MKMTNKCQTATFHVFHLSQAMDHNSKGAGNKTAPERETNHLCDSAHPYIWLCSRQKRSHLNVFNRIYSSSLCDQRIDIGLQCHVEAHEGGHSRWHRQRHGDVLLLWTRRLLSQAGLQVSQLSFSKKQIFLSTTLSGKVSTLSGKVICLCFLENSLEGHIHSIVIRSIPSLNVIHTNALPVLLD